MVRNNIFLDLQHIAHNHFCEGLLNGVQMRNFLLATSIKRFKCMRLQTWKQSLKKSKMQKWPIFPSHPPQLLITFFATSLVIVSD